MLKIFIPLSLLLTGAWYSFADNHKQMPVRTIVTLTDQAVCPEKWMCQENDALAAIRRAVAEGERPLRIASYNVHKCTGMDARRDPDRIARVIRSLDADIISLQEVLSDPGDVPSAQVRYLAEKTGMYAAVAAPTKRKKDGLYGNALLSRFPISQARLHDISVGSNEPRGVIDADILIAGRIVRVISTHLGLWPAERSRQAERLLEILPAKSSTPLIVMGDMNGWVPGSPVLHSLKKRLGTPITEASFPASFAILPLDRIWVLSAPQSVKGGVYKSSLSRIASDHLPLVVTVPLDALFSGPTSTQAYRF